MELAGRKDVPEELTWDLSLIYPTEADWQADFDAAAALAERIGQEFRGRLDDPERIVACLDLYEQLEQKFSLVLHYADLAVSVDYYDTASQERSAAVFTKLAEAESALSFIRSEISAAPDDVLEAAIARAVRSKNYLKEIRRDRPHRLSAETERALAALSKTFQTPSDVYSMAKLADMRFPSFTVDGREYPLGYSLFEDEYEYERDTAVRRAAFEHFSAKIRQYENVTAAAYNAQVSTEKVLATLRGFPSVFDYLLFDQKVTREMYDRQIDLITEKLAPHMRRYARLIQKKNGLDEMTFADLKLAPDPDMDPRVTIPEARETVRSALSVLGADYAAMVEEAFDRRWIDFAKNQGKSTGGFCASPYGRGSFILLSWNDRMADVFTIAHELGHAGHFARANAAQSYFDTDVSLYFVEAPSTMNELLLAQYLLRTNSDRRFRRWVLSSLIGNTYYHNFVTHLREAWYQREVYRIIDGGGSVNAETLSGLFRRNLELFWGDAVRINEGAELTWMRQPHYYSGLYSYTYSAGLTIATEVARRIEREGERAVEDWKRVLSAGSTLDPAGLAALAGVDITTDRALLDTIDAVGGIIDEICALTEELDGITV